MFNTSSYCCVNLYRSWCWFVCCCPIWWSPLSWHNWGQQRWTAPGECHGKLSRWLALASS